MSHDTPRRLTREQIEDARRLLLGDESLLRYRVDLSFVDALCDMALQTLSESGQMAKPEYLIDGKPYKTCDCRDNTDECPHGRKRTLLTTGFSRCVVPDLEEWVRMVEAKQTPSATLPTRELISEAVARGWCHTLTAEKPMDVTLASCISDEICALLESNGRYR